MHKFAAPAILSFFCVYLTVFAADDSAKHSPAEVAAIAKIQQQGGLVLEVAQNDPHLEVSYQQRGEKITDQCLADLEILKTLVHLNLRGQAVTDAMLVHLRPLTSLSRLHLELTPVTDKGLENLKGLVNLEYLNLYGTAVTDAGLKNLEGMKKLKSLYLWQTKVTDAGVARLRRSLPQVEIVRGLDLEKPKVETKIVGKPAVPKADKNAEAKKAGTKTVTADKKEQPKKTDAKGGKKEQAKKVDATVEKKDQPKKSDAKKQ